MEEVIIPASRFDLMQQWCRWLGQRLPHVVMENGVMRNGVMRNGWQGLLCLVVMLVLAGAAVAASPPEAQWSCDGEPLSVSLTTGAVDLRGLPSDVPNTEGNTAPGDGVLIQWRGQTLQLPRTNNAGAPSYTDGRWWWRALDPEHPEWKERRGKIISYTCTALEVEP